jgi:sulfide:quinone oxidoreductase
VVLVERDDRPYYLPGTIPTAVGTTAAEQWRVSLGLPGIQVVTGEAERVSGTGVGLTDGTWLEADAVIAASGLELDGSALPDSPKVHGFWDPRGAEDAARAVTELQSGVVAVVISRLPYRCPPAPYGLAMQLARLNPERVAKVILTTPEAQPLGGLGERVPAFLRDSLAEAGVELLDDFSPDLDALARSELRSSGAETTGFDLAFVVPPHVRSPALRVLPGEGPLVEVSPRFETAEENLFVVGDAAATPMPRAADAAASAGRTAADAVLERLGLQPEEHRPNPECYIGHGGGMYSRISLSYPNGLPPVGTAEVSLDGPSRRYADEFEAAFDRWRELRAPHS